MKKKISYQTLKPGDIFFSHGVSPTGWLIRVAQKMRLSAGVDRDLPNHAGFVTEDHGQLFATEMSPKGLVVNSLEKYNGKRNYVTNCLRWVNMNDRNSYELMCNLAHSRRKMLDYDWAGAIGSSPLGRLVLPFMKNKKNRDYCSENVYLNLVRVGYDKFPKNFKDIAPNPLVLFTEFVRSGKFLPVNFYKE